MKYNPSVHAVERIREYFGVMEESAKAFANELMRTAKYVTTQRDGKLVYKHADKDAMLVVDAKSCTIVTVLPPAGAGKRNKANAPSAFPEGNAIIAAARATIQRELAKARRNFTSELRKLQIEQAELGVEIAQAIVNKARCKAPHTQALIQERIDAMQTYYDVVGAKIAKEQSEYNRVRTEAQAFISIETTEVSV